MKRYTFLVFIAMAVSAFATPDYERKITEIILGTTSDGLLIYQAIYDTKNPGDDYILIKDIVDGQLVVKQKIVVKSMSDVQKAMQAKDFSIVLPELFQEKYFQLYGGNNHIYFLGSTFGVYDILPKELWSFRVDKIEGIVSYKDYELIILLLVSQNGFEQMRKVLVLKPPKES